MTDNAANAEESTANGNGTYAGNSCVSTTVKSTMRMSRSGAEYVRLMLCSMPSWIACIRSVVRVCTHTRERECGRTSLVVTSSHNRKDV